MIHARVAQPVCAVLSSIFRKAGGMAGWDAPGLEALEICGILKRGSSMQLDDVALAHIARACPALRSLRLCSSTLVVEMDYPPFELVGRVTAAGLSEIARLCPALQLLDFGDACDDRYSPFVIHGRLVLDEGALVLPAVRTLRAHLAGTAELHCPTLEELDVSGSVLLSSINLASIARLPRLRILAVRRCGLNADAVRALLQLPGIARLDASDNPLKTAEKKNLKSSFPACVIDK